MKVACSNKIGTSLRPDLRKETIYCQDILTMCQKVCVFKVLLAQEYLFDFPQ